MTAELSTDYASNKRVINEEQTIDLKLWREASSCLSDAEYLVDTENVEGDIFYVASLKTKDQMEDFNLETVLELNNRKFESFDVYVKKRHDAFYTLDLNKKSWLKSKCSCSHFMKNYICKHIVGLALRNKLCKLPKKALTVKLQKNP